MIEKEKPKTWRRWVIYGAIAAPSVVLFLNDTVEYKVLDVVISPFLLFLLAGAGAFLFYQNFIDKTWLKTKPADIGQGTQPSNLEHQKPYSPYNEGRPPF